MPRSFTTFFALLLVLLPLSGCETLEQREKTKTLTSILHKYETTIRWSYLRRAYGFMKPEAARKAKIPPGLENIKVTSYEVLEPPTPVGENSFAQVVLINYVEKDRQQQKSLMDRQLWEYDEEAKRWHLISNIPRFVAEPKIRTSPLK